MRAIPYLRRVLAHPLGHICLVVVAIAVILNWTERGAESMVKPQGGAQNSTKRVIRPERMASAHRYDPRNTPRSGKPRPLSDQWVLATSRGVVDLPRDREEDLKRIKAGLPVEIPELSPLAEALVPFDSPEAPSIPARVDAFREAAVAGIDAEDGQLMVDFLRGARNLNGRELWFADELFGALRSVEPPPFSLDEAFSGIMGDRSADPNVRDYAAQHLGHLLEAGRAGAGAEQELFKAAGAGKGTLAGTALMSLQRASAAGTLSSDPALVGELANSLATDATTSVSSRIAAIGVLDAIDPQRARSLADNLSHQAGVPLAMRSFLRIYLSGPGPDNS